MHHAKKSFGQHFLNRPDIALRIAESLELSGSRPFVLEVGPGQGMLTQHLLAQPISLVCVEADRDLRPFLVKKFGLTEGGDDTARPRIFFDDFLNFDLNKAFDGQEFSLIGNFPYNISSQILIKMIDHKMLIPEMVGMFQLEVAERVVAKPGGKAYGVISLLCQAFYEGKRLFNVDKSCFSPPPKVQSAVIRLSRKANLDLGCDEKLFKQVVKQTFNQRRKMLRNTLRPFFNSTPSVLDDVFYTKRPEQLSLDDFITICTTIEDISR